LFLTKEGAFLTPVAAEREAAVVGGSGGMLPRNQATARLPKGVQDLVLGCHLHAAFEVSECLFALIKF
jgi:hypothetical protein